MLLNLVFDFVSVMRFFFFMCCISFIFNGLNYMSAEFKVFDSCLCYFFKPSIFCLCCILYLWFLCYRYVHPFETTSNLMILQNSDVFPELFLLSWNYPLVLASKFMFTDTRPQKFFCWLHLKSRPRFIGPLVLATSCLWQSNTLLFNMLHEFLCA